MAPASTSDGKSSKSKNMLKPSRNSSQTDTQQSQDRSRVFWTPSQDRALIDLMLEQVRRGAKLGNSFRKEAWKHMLARFNSKFSLKYDVQQLKYRLKYYRNQYKIVKSFLDQGFQWDSANHTVIASTSVWESYLVENSGAVRHRDKPWPYYNDWYMICGPPSTASTHVELMEDSGGGTSDTQLGSPLVLEEELQMSPNPTDEDAEPNRQNKFQLRMAGRPEGPVRRRAAAAAGLQNALNNIAEAMRFKETGRGELRQDRWPVERCIEQLDGIEGLEEELFLKALVAFRDEYNRRVFLATKGDLRKSWLRSICG